MSQTETDYLIEKLEESEGKEIESINFTDGSALVVLDLNMEILASIYQYAAEHNIDAESATVEMIKRGLKIMESNSDGSDDVPTVPSSSNNDTDV